MSHGPTTKTARFLAELRYGLVLAAASVAAGALAQNPRELPTLAPMIETISPAVVNIAVTSNVPTGQPGPQDELLRRFFDFEGPPGSREREIEGAGSGVIVDAANGYILTNYHVIANADKITVTLLENRSFSGTRRRLRRGFGPRGTESRRRKPDEHPVRRFVDACASATTSSRSAIRSASRTA